MPAVQDGKVFLVLRGELEGRFDAIYYSSATNLEIVTKTSYPVRKLSTLCEMQRGRFSFRPRNDPRFYGGQYPFIQTGDVVSASKANNSILATQSLNDLGLSVSKLFNFETIVITIAANIGDTAILDYPACFPDSLVSVTPKNNELELKYLNIYFKLIKTYLENLAPQAAQKNINLQQLSPTPIVVPPLEIQHQIIQKFEAAFDFKRAKEAEAAQLLASIDGYLLEQLGITFPEKVEKKTSFFVSSEKVSGGRFDPFYFANQHFKIEGGLYENKPLKMIATLDKGQSITKDKILAGDYPVVAGGQTSPYTHQNYNQESNVITVSASGAYSGYVWYHQQRIFASDCTVIRSKDESELSTLFLAEILKLKQKEIYNMQQGAGQPHVYASDLSKLMVPLPPRTVQAMLIEKISEFRAEAQRLEAEAKAEVEAAKKEVETMILGDGGSQSR